MQHSSWGMGTSVYLKHNMATLRQKLVVKKITENLGKKKMKPLGKILRESGYSRETSETPKNVTKSKGYIKEAKPFLDRLLRIRDQALAELERRGSKGVKLKMEQYHHLTDSIEKFTKLSELLSGKPTERIDFKGWTPAELAEYASTGKIPGRFNDES